jgi:AcrR family transcriptional regulator
MGHTRLLEAATATVIEGLATDAKTPNFEPLDLGALAPPTIAAFDRAGALAAKREALIRVASRLFNRKGIDATSLEEIAAQVGATKRTLHHHLGSKADLVLACYERAFNIFFHIKDRAIEYPGTRMQALAAAMHALARAYPSEELSPLSPLVGFGALSPEGQAKMDQLGALLGQEYHALIQRGMREGSIHEVDVEARALMLPGLISWLVKDDVPSDPTQQQQIAREIANLVAVGLARVS